MKNSKSVIILSVIAVLLFNFLFGGFSSKAYVVNTYVAFNPQTGGFYGGIEGEYPATTNEYIENYLKENGYIFVKETDILNIYGGNLLYDDGYRYDHLINYFVATGKLPAWYTEIPWDGKGANKVILNKKLANNSANTGSGSTIKQHSTSQKIDLKKKKISIKKDVKYPGYNFNKRKSIDKKNYLLLDLKKGSKSINANNVKIQNSNDKVAKVIISKGKLYLMPFKKGSTRVTIKNGTQKTIVTIKFTGYIK